MISRIELDFAEKFIAAISCLNIRSIPFGEDRFQKGMDRLAELIETGGIDSKYREAISLLFIRKPVTGTYDRMLEALQYLNGSSISFAIRNPRFETTEITVPYVKAERLLDKSSEDFPKTFMLDAAKKFCVAAEVLN